jgi:tetratricopeptide (TPR) repeat protein
MVREWYRASLAWMQLHEDYDTTHLAHGLGLFGADADILFLAVCQREAFAAPRIQTAAHNTEFPSGLGLNLLTDVGEWESAEKLFLRALEAQPNAIGTRIHLGHVLLRLGRYQEAAIELRQAVPLVDAYDASRAAFERAASLYPSAQSPWLALSELARRRGDRPGALRAIDRLFALPADEDRRDPWWTYQIAQARSADRLMDGVRRVVREGVAP